MKKISLLFILKIAFLISYGQLNVTIDTPLNLVGEFSGGNATFISSQGSFPQFGKFTETTPTINISNGIVLSSAILSDSSSFNPGSVLTSAGTPGYSLLSQDINFISTNNASVLTFYVVSTSNTISFRYVYASDEYEYNNISCYENLDPMGIYINGPNPLGGEYTDTNIAKIPSTNQLVNASTINNSSCSFCPCFPQYHINNYNPYLGLINFVGNTIPLTATIPTIPGQGYYISIAIADSYDGALNCALFLDTDYFIQQNNFIPIPYVSASSSPEVCYGDSVTLTSSFAYGNLWSTGDTTQSITVGIQGDYTVSVENNGTTYTSLPFTVTVNTPSLQPPTISSMQGFEFCPGSYIELISSNPSNNLWSTGETTQSIQVHQPGTFYVQENINGCEGLSSDSVTITHLPSPNPSIYIWGAMPTFYFGTDMTNTNQVYWNFGDGSPVDSSINPTHTYTQIGNYQVQLIKVGDYCTQYTGDIIEIWNLGLNEGIHSQNTLSIFPSPAQNFITVNILSASEAVSYRITDISGRIVQQGNLKTGNQSSFNLDVSVLTTGLYYLDLEANATNVSFKPIPFIKE